MTLTSYYDPSPQVARKEFTGRLYLQNICNEISFHRILPEFQIENFNTTDRIFDGDYL